MSYELVATGSILELSNISEYEGWLDEGDKGLLEIDLRLPVSGNDARSLEDKLKRAGVAGVRVTTASPMLRVYFTKGFPWLAVIAAAILGMVVIAVMVIGWRIFREVVPESLQPVVAGLGAVLLLGLGAVLLSRRL